MEGRPKSRMDSLGVHVIGIADGGYLRSYTLGARPGIAIPS